MNKILRILLLLSISVYAEMSSSPNKASYTHEHRGFYSSIGTGFAYASSSKSDKDDDEDDRWKYLDFCGFTFPLMEFRFGASLANLIAFYTIFNFAFFYGESEYTDTGYFEGDPPVLYSFEKSKDDNAILFRNYVGFGFSIYPFRDKNSALNGFFVGGSVGYAPFVIYSRNDYFYSIDYAFQVEIGKDWWVAENFSVGVGFSYSHGIAFVESDSSKDGTDVIQLMLRLTRG